MSKLYIVPTPIGNLEDITLRALRILKEVDLILAEDTRTSSKLLKHYEINKKLQSYHAFNEHKAVEGILNQLKQGLTIALISDAGTPAISDPGYLIVKHCIEHEIDVECLPGATSFVPAIVNSGLPNDGFCFEGFLPQKKGRNKKLTSLQNEERTMIFFESPFRLVKTLSQFIEFFGAERKACVCRELSKMFEENSRGNLQELFNYYNAKTVKGEIVIVLEGLNNKKSEEEN